MSILSFTEFIPSTLSAAGKKMPPKAKGSDGNTYALFGPAVEVVHSHLEEPLEVVTEVKQNGKYTNYSVTSARLPIAPNDPSAGPESPTTSTSPISGVDRSTSTLSPSVETAGRGKPAVSFTSDAVRQRLIVKQSCLKAAVELEPPNRAVTSSLTDILRVADQFVDWVFKEEVYGLTENREGGGDSGQVTHVTQDSAPHSSPAARALETARSKAADIRAAYQQEDAVCAECGRKEFIKPYSGSFFCSKRDGGCGAPERGSAWIHMSYGEWLSHQPAAKLRRPDAPLVGPSSHPTGGR